MYCQRCSEAVEPGAAYCGNCGQALAVPMPLPPAPFGPPSESLPVDAENSADVIPSYAQVDPIQQKAETRAMIGLIVAVLAIPAAAIPLLGWGLAIAGLILATTIRHHMARKLMANLAISFSTVGLLLSLGVFIHVSQAQTKPAKTMTAQSDALDDGVSTVQGGVSAIVDTPCYSVAVTGLGKIDSSKDSCNARLYDADTLAASSQALVIDAIKQDEITALNFAEASKGLVDEYLAGSLPGFTIGSQRVGSFAGSKAYIVEAKNGTAGTAMQLAIVLHASGNGENLFVVAHARNAGRADLATIAKTWEWK